MDFGIVTAKIDIPATSASDLHRRDGEKIAGRGGGIEFVRRERERRHADAVVKGLGRIEARFRERGERTFRHDGIAGTDAETRDGFGRARADVDEHLRARDEAAGGPHGAARAAAMRGVNPRETREMWDEALRHIVGCWTEDEHAFDGRYWQMPKRRVLPKPRQDPHPPIWGATSSVGGHYEIGSRGIGLLALRRGGRIGVRIGGLTCLGLCRQSEYSAKRGYRKQPHQPSHQLPLHRLIPPGSARS